MCGKDFVDWYYVTGKTRSILRQIMTGEGRIMRSAGRSAVAAAYRSGERRKELKARITRIYNWTREQAEIDPPQDSGSLVARLYEAQAGVNRNKARARSGKVKVLQENAKRLAFLQSSGITSMQQLYEKVSVMEKVPIRK